MEFKFRAIDGRSPPQMATMSFPSSTLGSGFMAGQEMLGRDFGLSSEPSGKPAGYHLHPAIQREIEKEQIRQEIMATVTARRKELVAEVMKEMVMEKEINFKRSPYQSLFERQLALADSLRFTPCNAFTSPMLERLPFQQMPQAAAVAKVTPNVESNKGKLIVLDRPDCIGAKRKLEAPPAASTGALHMLSQKKKRREEWSCSLCMVTATCERGLNEHLLGKKHKAKEAALIAKQTSNRSKKMTRREKKSSSKLTCLEQTDGEKSVEPEPECKRTSKVKFWCEICNAGANSKSAMRKHESGKKQKARIWEQNKNQPETASTSKSVCLASPDTTATAPAITVPPSDTETKMATGDVVLQEEKGNDVGLKGQTADKLVLGGLEIAREYTGKRKFKFWCEICNIGTHTKEVMKNHIHGRKHKTRVEKQNHILAQEGNKGDQTLEWGNSNLEEGAAMEGEDRGQAESAVFKEM